MLQGVPSFPNISDPNLSAERCLLLALSPVTYVGGGSDGSCVLDHIARTGDTEGLRQVAVAIAQGKQTGGVSPLHILFVFLSARSVPIAARAGNVDFLSTISALARSASLDPVYAIHSPMHALGPELYAAVLASGLYREATGKGLSPVDYAGRSVCGLLIEGGVSCATLQTFLEKFPKSRRHSLFVCMDEVPGLPAPDGIQRDSGSAFTDLGYSLFNRFCNPTSAQSRESAFGILMRLAKLLAPEDLERIFTSQDSTGASLAVLCPRMVSHGEFKKLAARVPILLCNDVVRQMLLSPGCEGTLLHCPMNPERRPLIRHLVRRFSPEERAKLLFDLLVMRGPCGVSAAYSLALNGEKGLLEEFLGWISDGVEKERAARIFAHIFSAPLDLLVSSGTLHPVRPGERGVSMRESLLQLTARTGNIQLLELYLRCPGVQLDVFDVRDDNGYGPVGAALVGGHEGLAVRVLGALVQCSDQRLNVGEILCGPGPGSAPLLVAAMQGQNAALALMLELIRRKCPDAQVRDLMTSSNSAGQTTLHIMMENECGAAIGPLLVMLRERIKADAGTATALLMPLLCARDADGNTPLHLGLQRGNGGLVLSLLKLLSPGDLLEVCKTSNSGGVSVLQAALLCGNRQVLKLLQKSLNPDQLGEILVCEDHTSRTPLHAATLSGDVELFSLVLGLLGSEAAAGLASLCDINGNGLLTAAVGSGNGGMVRAVLAAFPDFLKETHDHNNEGQNILHAAVGSGDPAILHLILGQLSANSVVQLCCCSDRYANTPLHMAVAMRNIALLRLMLQKVKQCSLGDRDGIFCTTDSSGSTVLHLAVALGDVEMVKLVADTMSTEALYGVMLLDDVSQARGPLHTAAVFGNVEIVKCLVERLSPEQLFKVLSRVDLSGNTPFCLAAAHGNVEIVKLFIKRLGKECYCKFLSSSIREVLAETSERAQEDPSSRGDAALNILVNAAVANHPGVITQILKPLSAERRFAILAHYTYGCAFTPLHMAVLHNNLDCANALLRSLMLSGGDSSYVCAILAQPVSGLTPLHCVTSVNAVQTIARCNIGRPDMCEMLRIAATTPQVPGAPVCVPNGMNPMQAIIMGPSGDGSTVNPNAVDIVIAMLGLLGDDPRLIQRAVASTDSLGRNLLGVLVSSGGISYGAARRMFSYLVQHDVNVTALLHYKGEPIGKSAMDIINERAVGEPDMFQFILRDYAAEVVRAQYKRKHIDIPARRRRIEVSTCLLLSTALVLTLGVAALAVSHASRDKSDMLLVNVLIGVVVAAVLCALFALVVSCMQSSDSPALEGQDVVCNTGTFPAPGLPPAGEGATQRPPLSGSRDPVLGLRADSFVPDSSGGSSGSVVLAESEGGLSEQPEQGPSSSVDPVDGVVSRPQRRRSI
ncbi:ankyrin repeat family protein [Neorickettsia helminthoeca str. Oregon]|uniref:Ankyrin repeat family protein n=1 Tax=Neorickettsia helminthoeca str. Oregon TaxID=1286528 RepID=X5H394_9RICK|nr:ankyrin repeat family protein [Neorickettsia helminthoeca str. Oregon]